MNKTTMSTLNLVFAIVLFMAAIALLATAASKTVAIALIPVAFANLTIGIVARKKADL